jgi:hypothetical protein
VDTLSRVGQNSVAAAVSRQRVDQAIEDVAVLVHNTPERAPFATEVRNTASRGQVFPGVGRRQRPGWAYPGLHVRHQERTAAAIRITSRVAISASTSRLLRQKEPRRQMPWLMRSAGNRWRLERWVVGGVFRPRSCHTEPKLDRLGSASDHA